MSIFLLEDGEMMNDIHGIINYDGDEKLMISCDRLLSGQIIDFKRSY